MKKTAGYTVDFANNTITLTKAFAQRAKNPSSAEFRELAKLHKNLPDFTITMRTAVITADKETHGGLTIDWMTDYIKNYKDEVAVAEFEEVKKFYKKMPGYYGKVKAWLANVVIDRFGKDITMVPDDEKHFTIHTDIEVSPQFFGWVCGLGKAVRILAPAEVVEEMGNYVKGIAEMY